MLAETHPRGNIAAGDVAWRHNPFLRRSRARGARSPGSAWRFALRSQPLAASPSPRPFRNPFEVLPFGGGLLMRAAVADYPLDLSPGRGVHERVEREVFLEDSRRIRELAVSQKIAIVERCSHPSL